MYMKRFSVAIVAGLLGVLSLSGCAHKQAKISERPISIKMVAKAEQQNRQNKLEVEGIKVIHVGEMITVILPSDAFFNTGSANLSDDSQALLSDVIGFLKHYEAVSVKVTGYTDNQGDAARDKALTTQQAEQVASYLWAKGIEARMVYPIGVGKREAIASNESAEGRATNRRIEIDFRYLPPSE